MANIFRLDKTAQDFIKISFGNILEWYDFTIYGLFAVQLSKAFFPTDSRFISLLLIFATFAIGFIVRPVGSLIFGMVGDRKGKHYAVNLSIWLMAIPTALIAFLPTYSNIGLAAPIALILLRICQGISAGGQFSGLIAIAVDSDSNNKPLLVSLIYSISVIGCFVASFVGGISVMAIGALHSDNLVVSSLGWRIPFLVSSVLFIIYIKLVPDFNKHSVKDDSRKFTFKAIFLNQPKEMSAMVILNFASGTIYYILYTYLITYIQVHLNINRNHSFLFMNGLLILSIILYPSFGYLANKLDCRVTAAGKCCLLMLVASIGLALVHLSLWFWFIGTLGMVIGFCAVTSLVTSLYAELFDERYRMTACSLSFNIGVSLAGFAPFIGEIVSKLFAYGLSVYLLLIIGLMYFVLRLVSQTTAYQRLQLQKSLLLPLSATKQF